MSDMFETKAYHQSGLDNAQRSITWQGFFVGDNENLWLGNGIYFWEYYRDACWWDGHYRRPVILSAQLRCRESTFLNLDDDNQKMAFLEYMSSVIEHARQRGVVVVSADESIIAGGSCNYYKDKNGTKLIKYSFPEKSGKPQFCATDSSVTKDIKMVSFEHNGSFKEVQNEYF